MTMKNQSPPKLTKAEAGRLGGKKSRGGGRPRKYKSEQERRAARVLQQQEYLRRLADRKNQPKKNGEPI